MPVSYLPCITPLLLIAVPLLLLFKSRLAAGVAAIMSFLMLSAFFLSIYIPGWRLHSQAAAGDPVAQYRYAQWLENHSEQVGAVVLWPFEPDVYGGFAWLQKSAAQNYPPAVWLVGVRFKYGIFVPQPADWKGPGGNIFPQPERGQPMIDHAVNDLGYSPPADAESYYFQHYRRNLPP
jgi:TPR repeat protein